MNYIGETGKPISMSLALAKPNRKQTIIAHIKDVTNRKRIVKFNSINELTFSIPYEVVVNGNLVRNHVIDKIRERFLVRVKIDTFEEWYIITKIERSSSDQDWLNVSCFSLGYELKYKKIIDYVAKSYNLLEVANECFKGSGWKVGYIHPDFNLKRRQFDVSSKTLLDFINELCDTFEAYVTYDTINRTVNFLKEEQVSVYKGFWISYGKYLETLSDTTDLDEIVTRLVVNGNESASIVSVNPTGQSYLDDFSYFLFPFERDENRNVITSSYYMDDDLSHSILDYNELINKHDGEFKTLLQDKTNTEREKTEFENKKQELQSDLTIAQDNIRIAQSNNEDTSHLVDYRNSIQAKINIIQQSIDSLNRLIDENNKQINDLKEVLQLENNFSEDLLNELYKFVQIDEFSDDNIVDDEDLLVAAVKELKKRCIPTVNLSIGMVNFFEILGEKHDWDRLFIGDIIRVKHNKLGIDVKTTVTEMSFDYENLSIDITVSNSKKPQSIMDRMTNAIYTIDKVNTDYSKRKPNFISATTNFNTRNDRIREKPVSPEILNITHIENDNGSVNLSFSWSYPDINVIKNDAYDIDGFLIFLYTSDSNDGYSVGSGMTPETVYSVESSVKSHTFTSMAANRYYSIGIKAYRRVDTDVQSDGIIFSDIAIPLGNNLYPYLPSDVMKFKGTLNGYKTETTNVANTIPVRNKEGIIDTSITGSASSINGKELDTPNGIATLDENGIVKQLPNFPKMTFGDYTGDGTAQRKIVLGFTPALVKIYSTNKTESTLYIPSTSGGFLMSINSSTSYLLGTSDTDMSPTLTYGKLDVDGFVTGNGAGMFGNKLNTTYHWEAYYISS
ncbi:DUF7359 domain-containing protein [Bacillus xiapuensis]|uniref:Phage tail protein n=1 Tax=Bacillus xiapuensis TaxID=2014075 RepID=A0ABU6N864_9BACI|nr:phage tail protein [Bacillus xiapuensis]